MRHSNKERDNVAESRAGSNTAYIFLADSLMEALCMKICITKYYQRGFLLI